MKRLSETTSGAPGGGGCWGRWALLALPLQLAEAATSSGLGWRCQPRAALQRPECPTSADSCRRERPAAPRVGPAWRGTRASWRRKAAAAAFQRPPTSAARTTKRCGPGWPSSGTARASAAQLWTVRRHRDPPRRRVAGTADRADERGIAAPWPRRRPSHAGDGRRVTPQAQWSGTATARVPGHFYFIFCSHAFFRLLLHATYLPAAWPFVYRRLPHRPGKRDAPAGGTWARSASKVPRGGRVPPPALQSSGPAACLKRDEAKAVMAAWVSWADHWQQKRRQHWGAAELALQVPGRAPEPRVAGATLRSTAIRAALLPRVFCRLPGQRVLCTLDCATASPLSMPAAGRTFLPKFLAGERLRPARAISRVHWDHCRPQRWQQHKLATQRFKVCRQAGHTSVLCDGHNSKARSHLPTREGWRCCHEGLLPGNQRSSGEEGTNSGPADAPSARRVSARGTEELLKLASAPAAVRRLLSTTSNQHAEAINGQWPKPTQSNAQQPQAAQTEHSISAR